MVFVGENLGKWLGKEGELFWMGLVPRDLSHLFSSMLMYKEDSLQLRRIFARV